MIPVLTMMTACGFPLLSLILIYVHPKIGLMSSVCSKFKRGKIWCLKFKPLKTRKPNQIDIFNLLWESSTLVNDFSVLFCHQEMALTKSVFMQRCLFQPPFIGKISNKNPIEVGKFWKFCTWKFLKTVLRTPASLGELRFPCFGMNMGE